MEKSKYIFMSYSHQDSEVAEAVAIEIEKRLSIQVWMDNKELQPGDVWEEKIDDALKNAAVVLSLVSSKFLKSRWLVPQAEQAIKAGIPLIPVIIESINFSDIPDPVQKIQAVRFPEEKEKLFSSILIYISEKTSENEKPPIVTVGNTAKKGRRKSQNITGPSSISSSGSRSKRKSTESSDNKSTPDDKPAMSGVKAPVLEDQTPFHKDSPSTIDYLGRIGFVEAMARWLNRYWGDYKEGDKSFIVNLHGQWGAGKTTFLKLLEQMLRPPDKLRSQDETQNTDTDKWIVVWFNAWENRHIKPEWWALFDKIYRESVSQKDASSLDKWWIQLQEWWWRFYSGRKLELLGFFVSLFLLGLTLYWVARTGVVFDAAFMANMDNAIKLIAAILSLLSTIFLGTRFVSQTISSGSAKAAEVYLQFTADPIENIKRHFRDLVEIKIKAPIIVFIDDLDRCDRTYLVNLLESTQNLLNHGKVFYVISADQRWLFAAFEETYKEFKDSIKEPGKKIGYLFLEKIFQLSVWIPNVSDASRVVYLNHLLGRDDQLKEMREQIQKQVAKVKGSSQAMIDMIQSKPAGSIDKVLVRDVVVAEMASLKIEKETTHFLTNFAHLMDPNPRTLKRLVTFFGVLRAIAIQRDEEIVSDLTKRNQLALWAIVKMRWPLLADYLEEYPQYLDNFKSGKSNQGIHPDVSNLVKDREVRDVLCGKDINGPGNNCELDDEALQRFILLKATERTF